MNLLAAQPHWIISTVAGALLGVLFGLVPTWFENIRQYRYGLRIKGEWNSYFFARVEGQMKFHGEKWRISRSLWRGLVLSAWAPSDPTRTYSGTLSSERDQICALIKSHAHKETIVIRFREPIDFSKRELVGIGLTYDFDGTPHASVNVISEAPLNEEQVRLLIRTHCVAEPDEGNLSLMPRAQPAGSHHP